MWDQSGLVSYNERRNDTFQGLEQRDRTLVLSPSRKVSTLPTGVMPAGSMPRQDRELYEFEGFVVDPYRRLLTRDGEPVPLPPKALATLVALLERHGQVVEKEELIQTVWPATFITEATLTQNVFRLRKALGEEAGEHRFIVTIPGRGYSFVAAVRRRAPVLSASGEFPRVELPPPAVPIAQPVTPPASPPIDPAAPPTALPAAPQAPP